MEKNNRLFLDRKSRQPQQILGDMYVVNNDELKEVYKCKTLELPYKDNQRNISSIPSGVYRCKKRFSPRYGLHIHILNVPDRDMILIHVLNYYTQTRGCIGVGNGYGDINGDGVTDLLNSRQTLNELLSHLDNEFVIVVL